MDIAEETTTHEVHFSIEGGFLTQLARDFVREGNWRKAYSFLMDNLHGMDAQVALDILQGKKQLTGVNDLELADDDCEAEVKGWLDFQFSQCFSFEGRVYQPYGMVTAYRREDWRLAQKIAARQDEDMLHNPLWLKAIDALSDEPVVKSFNAWGHYDEELKFRPAFYARRRDRDLCAFINLTAAENRPVLFSEVRKDVPLWYTLPSSAADAARAAYEDGELLDLSNEAFPDDFDVEDDEPAAQTSQAPADTPAAPAMTREQQLQAIEEDEKEAEREAARYDMHLEILRQQIAHQADHDTEYGWLDLKGYDEDAGQNVELRVPHRAFVCAALGRAKAWHLMPEYDARCPSGLKMYNDDRYHSDAWIGAGLRPEDAYDDDMPKQRLFMRELYDLQRRLLSFPFDVLARGKEDYLSGTVTHDPLQASKDRILVLKAAAPEFADAALRSKAVIVETGSKLAHLVIVSREESIPVVRMDHAVERFREGRRVSIDFKDGSIELSGI